MIAVGIKQLKNRLSEYVRRAAAGEIVLVTDRETVVAELRAPEVTRSTQVFDAALADLVRTGVMVPARSKAPLRLAPSALPDGVSLLSDLLADRDSESK